jgi:hypothetical protein
LIINHLNQIGPSDVLSLDVDAPFLDVNGDGWVAPIDALAVINALNRPTTLSLSAITDIAMDQLFHESALLEAPELIDTLLLDDNGSRLPPAEPVGAGAAKPSRVLVDAALIDLFADGAEDEL